jgi:hypothetical protein
LDNLAQSGPFTGAYVCNIAKYFVPPKNYPPMNF